MKNRKLARRIAENVVFGNQTKLTDKQKEILKQSPFSNVVELIESKESKFLKLAESVLEQANLIKDQKPNNLEQNQLVVSKKNKLRTGYNKSELLDLVFCIEEKFNLNVPYDYNNIDIKDLKEFIADYAENRVFDEDTQRLVSKLSEKNSPEEIMGTIRFYIRH